MDNSALLLMFALGLYFPFHQSNSCATLQGLVVSFGSFGINPQLPRPWQGLTKAEQCCRLFLGL